MEGVRLEELRMERGISPVRDFVSVIKMIFLILRERPDIVQSYTPKAGLVTMLAAFLCRTPVRIHTFTGLVFPTQSGVKRRILIWIDRLISACATLVVPEGEGVRRDLQRFSITKEPLHVIGHGNIAGVDTCHFRSDLLDLHHEVVGIQSLLPVGGFTFCFVGRLNNDKGISELEDAFSKLPQNARLLLVGGMDYTSPISERTLESLRANPRVLLLGFQRDIRPALVASKVLVLPSYREGFPNVILQAGAMELPVIASNINGCNEVIEAGVNGWLVPPRDSDALYLSMLEAMNMPESVRVEMGKRARTRIQERFEQKDHWRRILLCYKNQLV